jgi:hypothetical protein
MDGKQHFCLDFCIKIRKSALGTRGTRAHYGIRKIPRHFHADALRPSAMPSSSSAPAPTEIQRPREARNKKTLRNHLNGPERPDAFEEECALACPESRDGVENSRSVEPWLGRSRGVAWGRGQEQRLGPSPCLLFAYLIYSSRSFRGPAKVLETKISSSSSPSAIPYVSGGMRICTCEPFVSCSREE